MAPPTNHHHHLLLLAAFSIIVIVSCETVSHLPGFSGELPFNLQTGYINVGDGEMFYYFVESEDNPRVDPLLLWLTGGPGCSSWNGLVYEIGPLEFDLDHSLTYGGLPRLRSYEYSWTKTASIIFLDSPVGTGFSYSTTLEGWPSSDTKAANDAYQFLLKWLEEHPQYLQVPLFLGGDAYSGIVVPLLTKLVAEGNEAGDESYLNLKGYLVGSPNTDEFIDANSKIEFAHRMALISDKNFAALKKSCNGNYINVDPNNTDCILALDTYEMCVSGIWENHILEPKCSLGRPQDDRWTRRSLVEDENEFLLSTPNRLSGLLCRNFNYSLSETWLNNKSVRKALHIREGTVKRWSRCNKTISYTKDQPSVINVHQDLAKYELNVLVTVGDRDMATPFVAVVEWINILKRSLNLTLAEHWRPWFVDAQVGGYTRKFAKKPTYSLTYATVKGGGHTSAEYYRKECYEMFNRWRRLLRLFQATKLQEARGNADDSEWANLYDLEESGSTDGSPVNDSCGFPPRREMNNEMGNMEEKEDLKNRDGAKVLPFEFIALEACLEAACSSLDHEARTLEQEAHPALDKLTSKISTLNLERVRQIKSRLVALTGRVQKVRDELEHLLDDDDDMAEMYLTEKLAEQMLDDSSVSSVNEHDAMNEGVQPETDDRTAAEMTSEIHGGSARYESDAANAQDHYYGVAATLARSGTRTSTTRSAISKHLDVEELEMLLEAYFVQIDGTLNKLTTLREYVDDTEDYINIMLDDKQNHLLQMGVMLTTATLVVSAFVVVAGVFGMNITIDLFDDKKSGDPEFLWTVGGGATGTIVLYFLAIAWCKHKRLL